MLPSLMGCKAAWVVVVRWREIGCVQWTEGRWRAVSVITWQVHWTVCSAMLGRCMTSRELMCVMSVEWHWQAVVSCGLTDTLLTLLPCSTCVFLVSSPMPRTFAVFLLCKNVWFAYCGTWLFNSAIYTVFQKNCTLFIFAITLLILGRFW